MYASYMCGDYAGTGPHFRGGTLTEHLASQEPVNMTLYFRWVGEPGYQHTYTRVYGYDGQLLDTVPTGWINASGSAVVSSDTFPVHGVAEYLEQPTLTVDIEVEDNVVPAAVAGHYEFPKPDGCAGARKNYTYAIDNPDPEPDTPTELIAVSLNRNDGFVLKSWTGNCAYFDANGNYLGMLPKSVPDDPDDWITDDTIYVKCLEANPTQMASAMTGMAVLAGAIAEGAIPPAAFTAVSAQVQAQVEFAPNPTVVREDGMIWGFTEQQHDQDLLDAAGFDSTVHDIDRWVQTAACPGEIFKLTIIDPSADKMFELREGWKWERDGDHIEVQGLQPVDSVEHHDFSLFDICYVETKNQYVAWDPPIGLMRIYLSGSERVLKTLVVDYGIVRRFALSVRVHEQSNVTAAMIEAWLEDATNQLFLFDEYPIGASIKDRYVDAMDVPCPITLVMDSCGTFCDNDVEMRDALGEYQVIDDPYEYNFFVESVWALAHGKDILVVDGIQYHPLLGQTADCSTADPKGWESPLGHVYLSAAGARPAGTLAHELGHYIADLPDTYYCDATQGGCGRTPNECTCKCQQFNRARGDHHQMPGGCQCGFQFARMSAGALNPNNLMSNAAVNRAVLLEQKNAFLAAPAKPG